MKVLLLQSRKAGKTDAVLSTPPATCVVYLFLVGENRDRRNIRFLHSTFFSQQLHLCSTLLYVETQLKVTSTHAFISPLTLKRGVSDDGHSPFKIKNSLCFNCASPLSLIKRSILPAVGTPQGDTRFKFRLRNAESVSS